MEQRIVRSVLGRRTPGWLRHGVLCLILALFMGCATTKQVQYFEVVGKPDPTTGIANRNFYRMTIKGSSGLVGKYNMKAAYVSAETVDTLEGRTPIIPEADLSAKRVDQLIAIRNVYGEALLKSAQALGNEPATASSGNQEERFLQIARQLWFAYLKDQEVASMGRVCSADPYRFRKLVFLATAKSIKFDLPEYSQAIDNAIGSIGTIAEVTREREQARQSEIKARNKGLCEAIAGIAPKTPQGAAFIALMRAQLGVPAEGGAK